MVGGKAAVDALLQHPDVRAISFVGSTPVASTSTREGAVHGKRVQCQGGAKNHVVIMPDADLEMSAQNRQRQRVRMRGTALPGRLGRHHGRRRVQEIYGRDCGSARRAIRVGNGLDDGVQMGPVISPASKSRIEGLLGKGLQNGGKAILDGRNAEVKDGEKGSFLKPTILTGIGPDSELAGTEIFGPVLAMQQAGSLDEAIQILSTKPLRQCRVHFHVRRQCRAQVPL